MPQQSQHTLVEYLAQVPDFRRAEGRRYPLPTLLVMITMAIMSGRYGYRQIARFLKTNQRQLVDQLGLEREQMPSHVTVRTVLMHLDFEALNDAFRAWASDRLRLAPGDWVALDGKAIRSTVTDYDNAYQDFVCFVSAFAQQQGLVLGTERYHSKATSEITVTQDLIETLVETLGLEGIVFTLDALHCKKNSTPHSCLRQ
jgi:hypothetical protein